MKSYPFALLVLGLACGGSKPTTWAPPMQGRSERTIDHWTLADEDKYMALACVNIVAPDRSLRCPSLVKAGFTTDQCGPMLADWRTAATDPAKRKAFRLLLAGLSSATSCEYVDATFRLAVAAASGATTTPSSGASCPERHLTAAEMKTRRGQNTQRFSDTSSTATQPIDVCGVKGEVEWLTRVTCNDGSRPWSHDLERAHEARRGSTMATLAECGSTPIDIYTAPCPEAQYTLYMNMYMCGPGEHLVR